MENLTEQELIQKAKDLKNQYQKEWYDKNPGKRKEHVNRYWRKRAIEQLKKEEQSLNSRGL